MMTTSEECEMHGNLASVTICTASYFPNLKASSSMLLRRKWRPFSVLLVTSSNVWKKQSMSVENVVTVYLLLLQSWTKIQVRLKDKIRCTLD